jgi:hypothetical protein
MRFVFTWLLIAFVVIGWPAVADEKDALKKASEAELKEFQYPGSMLQDDHNAGVIAQYMWATPDSLEKVEEWYRKAFKIDKAYGGGVANIPWPSGVKATEAKGQQQWAIFSDFMRLKNDGTRNKDIRAVTTLSFLVRTPDHTLFTILNRGPQDKQTLIAVTVLQEAKK